MPRVFFLLFFGVFLESFKERERESGGTLCVGKSVVVVWLCTFIVCWYAEVSEADGDWDATSDIQQWIWATTTLWQSKDAFLFLTFYIHSIAKYTSLVFMTRVFDDAEKHFHWVKSTYGSFKSYHRFLTHVEFVTICEFIIFRKICEYF